MMIFCQKFGTPYIDGVPVAPGTMYDFVGPRSPKISLGDTVPGKEVTWILAGGVLIADCNLLRNVGWNHLNRSDLVFGKRIELDGHSYKVRLLRRGKDDGPSEWDNLLSVVGFSTDLLHMDDIWSLGADTDPEDEKFRYCWGKDTGNDTFVYFNDQAPKHGWRPVLEMPNLNHGPVTSLIGESVVICGRAQGVVRGVVSDATEYDLILKNACANTRRGENERFMHIRDEGLVVNLDEVRAIHLWDITREVKKI